MYTFAFVLLYCLGFYNCIIASEKKKLGACLFIAFFFLVFHDGFRWEIGTDWDNYIRYFSTCLYVDDSEYEIGYVLLNKLLYSISDNYSLLLILHAILIYAAFFYTFKKYSPYPLFSIFMFYCLMLTYLGMNRQYLSLVICYLAIPYIIKRKFIGFAGCIILAYFFHHSAILFIPAYFLCKECDTRFYFSILVVAILISLSGVINKIPITPLYLIDDDLASKADFYFGAGQEEVNLFSSILGILKRGIWIFLLLKFRASIKKGIGFELFFNLYFISVVLYLLFNGSMFQIIVARGLIYYNLFEVIMLPYLLQVFSNKYSKIIFYTFIALYGLYQMEKGMDYYASFGTDLYRPYKSILF